LVTMSCVLKLLGNMKLDIFISMEVRQHPSCRLTIDAHVIVP
jgi:hypothetical protein